MSNSNSRSNSQPGALSVRPLQGLKVVDFSTLLPGPMASLMLVEAGAEVVKIERPGRGDEMRSYEPRFGSTSANFAMLNRGKQSLALDLKKPDDLATARALALEADIVLEQFRPGVMARLGLSYADLAVDNPRLIYCSITGYGQDGPKAQVAAHDMNYLAESGLLSLVVDRDGMPTMPMTPIADIGGGAYPAVINILLALAERQLTGRGRYLDVSMSENVFPFMYWALASSAVGQPPQPSGELITGGSPRYRIYRTKDDRFLTAAPIESQFWTRFCTLVGVAETADVATVEATIALRTAAEWQATFRGEDVCCAIVATVEEAMRDPHVIARNVFSKTVVSDQSSMPALPLPLVPAYRDPVGAMPAPKLSEQISPSANRPRKLAHG
ncbi:MAG: CoA transferase [Burkholderiaceae bacterium]|nr:CoA transferase [Burkholderiaceae bacterium]